MSFLTCFWLLPQKEHLSRSPPSPMRATRTPPCRVAHAKPNLTLPVTRRASTRGAEAAPRDRYDGTAPDGHRGYLRRRDHLTAWRSGRDSPVWLYRAGRQDLLGTAASLRERTTSSTRPYATASSAVRILSRSMSDLTSSGDR